MGNFKEHILFGIITSLITIHLLPYELQLTKIEQLTTIIAILIGSVMPDIDHKNSYVYRATRATLSTGSALTVFIIIPFEIVQNFAISIITFIGVFAIITKPKIKHRGITHTLTFLLVLTALSTLTARITNQNPLIGLGLGLGILSHLLLDREFKFTP